MVNPTEKWKDIIKKLKHQNSEFPHFIQHVNSDTLDNRAIKFFSQPEKDDDYVPEKKVRKVKAKKKQVDRDIFRQLNKRFQEVVSWTKGEQSKVYGDDEWDRIRHYNDILKEGKALSKQLSQITKKKFKHMSYFNQFVEA